MDIGKRKYAEKRGGGGTRTPSYLYTLYRPPPPPPPPPPYQKKMMTEKKEKSRPGAKKKIAPWHDISTYRWRDAKSRSTNHTLLIEGCIMYQVRMYLCRRLACKCLGFHDPTFPFHTSEFHGVLGSRRRFNDSSLNPNKTGYSSDP